MLMGYSLGDLGSIMAMQGFAGLILFSVFLLMALGLAIIFGQMGVINMAHGEFMILGAYVTYLTATLVKAWLPGAFAVYFPVAIVLAFVASGLLGMLVEWAASGLVRPTLSWTRTSSGENSPVTPRFSHTIDVGTPGAAGYPTQSSEPPRSTSVPRGAVAANAAPSGATGCPRKSSGAIGCGEPVMST